ncbi:MAG: flagellar motor switch phosphatase FliY [Lachnospiraceae bacterium]|nr:flagellar motor switch phosphatase FliY [Lachnospiraceae bacterium]MDD6627342.1 flagellar motor switch phosphatase FliY [Lachnospiraceae bacterium]
MDGMLSQDEINALLSGMDAPSDVNETEEPAAAPAEEPISSGGAKVDESLLSDIEKDAIGEVANISMGSSATTLYSLVNRKVNITTPIVTLATWENVLSEYEKPCVFIQIKYTVGLDGSNILVLKEHDVKVITDLMMGGDGSNTDGELGELHLSAISEAMNQMMGSAATSLSTMLGKMIDISPPDASLVDLTAFKSGGDIAEFLEGTFVKIAFRMQIDDLVDSTIMQLYPIDFAKELYNTFISSQSGGETPASAPEPTPTPAPQMAAPTPAPTAAPQMDMSQMGMGQMGMPQMQMGMPQMGMPQMQMGMPQMQMGMPQMAMQPNMNIQPAQFQSFTNDFNPMQSQENISLIKDVPLEVTVELGRTSKSISDILDFAPGTIIELDKIAGEPIDVLVNGKFVAKGEVVVIEESFGVRVTEIIK